MIPKIIHYCWFGRNPKPQLAQKCIDSWYKFFPDYRIIEWNEDNFDVSQYPYSQYCYDTKRWAFLSDFVRLIVVYENGGIYFDTDVEVIKPFDDLVRFESFYGFENDKFVATGLGFGAEKNSKTVKSILNQYLTMKPIDDGSFKIDWEIPTTEHHVYECSRWHFTLTFKYEFKELFQDEIEKAFN